MNRHRYSQADRKRAEDAKAMEPPERFRRTAIGLVAMIKHDIEGPGYGQPERPNWHSLQVFLLLRGAGMLELCDEFLALVLGLPTGSERDDLLETLSTPPEDMMDEYIEALSKGTDSESNVALDSPAS